MEHGNSPGGPKTEQVVRKYIVTGCLRDWAVVVWMTWMLGKSSAITKGIFHPWGNRSVWTHYGSCLGRMESQQEWYRDGYSLSSLAILREMAGFFDWKKVIYDKCNEREQ